MRSYKYVILGGGNASGYAARTFVQKGVQPGELCIVTEEPVVAYERPALSKAYLFPEGPARLPGFHTCVGGGGERQPPEWYKERGIEYLTSTRVTQVDVAGKKLVPQDGDDILYDKLIVATGAKPVLLSDFKTPGADLGNVFYLRNVQDADQLVSAIQKCKQEGGKAVVIGGGYIGMECAAGLRLNGLEVTMVFPEPFMMNRLFNEELAAFYESYYQDKGIVLVKGTRVDALEGKGGKVSGAVLADGTVLPASLVLVGVGARPNVELFKGQLEMLEGPPGGIKVDAHMRTSHPDVYAVGDVAAFPLKMQGGQLVRQEHVTHCRQSAAHAVNAIYGGTEEYDYLPYFYSREFSLFWQFYGSNEGEPVVFKDSSRAQSVGAYWIKEGRVVGAFLEGGSDQENSALKVLARKQPPVPTGGVDELKKMGAGFAVSVSGASAM